MLRWFLEPEGLAAKDKLGIAVAKITYYLLLRPTLRLVMGKRSTAYVASRNLSLGSFSPFDVRVRYNGLVIHARHGDDDLSNLSPKHERRITRILAESFKDDDVFIDIGAHIGKYVLLAGQRIKNGRIVAIEPNPSTFDVLNKNIKLNKIQARLDCINAAISDVDGVARLRVNKRSSTCSIVEDDASAVEVRCIRLDSIVEELGIKKIDWLLIDVEGAEDKVMLSGKESIPLVKNMIVEIHSKANLALLKDYLLNNNFNVNLMEEGLSRIHLYATRIS